MFDKICPHHDGSFNVLLADSSVSAMPWSSLSRYFMDITKPIQLQRRPWRQ